jgi:DNA (cytosine-5)-methyltransferase 1
MVTLTGSSRTCDRTSETSTTIPVIDVFAGPGGLGEGFDALRSETGRPVFQVALSLEKDPVAHRTLELRRLVHQFPRGELPPPYVEYVQSPSREARERLFNEYRTEATRARAQAWSIEIGEENAEKIVQRVKRTLNKPKRWVLVGGPPCQAYSLVGRARRAQEPRQEFESDPRQTLYLHYLDLIRQLKPDVFVMENVKGLLSARLGGERVFDLIKNDLSHRDDDGQPRYRVYPLSANTLDWENARSRDFVVHAEDHGVPQTRHRVILLGIRRDITKEPRILVPSVERTTVRETIGDMPRLRSRLSRRDAIWDSSDEWRRICERAVSKCQGELSDVVAARMMKAAGVIQSNGSLPTGADRTPNTPSCNGSWYRPHALGQTLPNHVARAHMPSDLHRYLFCAAFAHENSRSPRLADFPTSLLPEHANVANGKTAGFVDRFRVQPWMEPASTITSHIAKDGHYYIHPDPAQCRSLTVREAARLQTFPDDYFFEGNRTQQYHQVGNAVPPILARLIASVVAEVLGSSSELDDDPHLASRTR